MAIYISAAQRRRKTGLIAAVAAVVGLALGIGLGTLTQPSVDDQVSTVKSHARETSAGLRVLALHSQAGVGGTADVAPTLAKTRKDVAAELADAPWVGASERDSLTKAVSGLSGTSSTFGTDVTRAADQIDQAFGVS